VHDVLERLRACARREAQLLFREQKRSPCPLPKASERVSHAINSVTDAVAAVLGSASEQQREEYTELLLPLFREHLPKVSKPLTSNLFAVFKQLYLGFTQTLSIAKHCT
jgi:hypothetical protein